MHTTVKQNDTNVFVLIGFLFVCIGGLPVGAGAASLILVSDTISRSVPGAPVDHVIRFTLTNSVPASGKIVITPQSGAFTIPVGFDAASVDLAVSGAERNLASPPALATGATLGLTVATGTSGSLTFRLSASDSIPGGNAIVVKIGTNAAFGTVGTQRIQNPQTIGSYRISIKTFDGPGALIDDAQAMVAILSPVFVGALKESLATADHFFAPTIATTTRFFNPDATKFEIEIPQDFVNFSDTVHLQITSFLKEKFTPAASPPAGKRLAGHVYDITFMRPFDGSTVASFVKPPIFHFFYQDADVADIDESTLKPFRWDGSQWAVVAGSTLFPAENRVAVSMSQLSSFMLMGEPPASAPPLAPPPATAAGGGGGGGGGGSGFSSVPTTYSGVVGQATIFPESGGSVGRLNADGSSFTLDLPKHFSTLPVALTITTLSKRTVSNLAPLPPNISIVGDHIYSLIARDSGGTVVGRLSVEAILSLRYTDAQAAGFDEATFKLYAFNDVQRRWEALETSQTNVGTNSLAARINRFTLFTLMGRPTGRPSLRLADLNGDQRVDLVDFSILLYNWGRPRNAASDINKDGRVDLVDFSILMYWWTG